MEYFFINKICLCVVAFLVTFALSIQLHRTAINYVYTDLSSTGDYNVMGSMSDKDKIKAQKILLLLRSFRKQRVIIKRAFSCITYT